MLGGVKPSISGQGRGLKGRSQWRRQECELGASPPLPPPSLPFPLAPPLPLLTGVRGYNPRNFLKLKMLVGEF